MIERPQVFTSHWRNPELRDLDATIIGISRGTPRGNPGFRYRILRSLAPGDEAWNAQSLKAYEEAYVRQLEEIGAAAILSALERIAGDRPSVLLCWERPHEEFCHRWTLSRWLEEQIGREVPELRAGMLRRRPDAAQPSLFDGEERR